MTLRIVVLGSALSARDGNPFAATYRCLLRALVDRGHDIIFLERDGVVAAADRDRDGVGWCALQFYDTVAGLDQWRPRMADADMVLLDTDVPDGGAVAEVALAASGGPTALLDIDTARTLRRLADGGDACLAPDIIRRMDVLFVASGGLVPRDLERRYGVSRVRILYPAAEAIDLRGDEAAEDDVIPAPESRWDVGYLGDFDEAVWPMLERLLIEPARRMPSRRFVVVGTGWPEAFRWPGNVEVISDLARAERAAFDTRLGWSLVLPRPDQVALAWTPPPRLFEAAGCATPVISPPWRGLSTLFAPGRDILVASVADDVIRALSRPEGYRVSIGCAGRARVRLGHTPAHRAWQFEAYAADVLQSRFRRRHVMVTV